MRFLLSLLALVAIVVIGLLSFGFISLNGSPGSLPTVKVEGGKAPDLSANVATVTVGSENKTVTVPTVSINKPGEPAPANTTAPK
jgi:hypothetical protein